MHNANDAFVWLGFAPSQTCLVTMLLALLAQQAGGWKMQVLQGRNDIASADLHT